MDYEVEWSPEALDDVDNIAAFIARDSEYYAGAVVRKIIEKSRTLNQLPERGRMVPELDDESIRELFVYQNRLMYRVQAQKVLIVAVVPGPQPLENAVGDRFDH